MAGLLAGIITFLFSKRLRSSRSQHAMIQVVAAVNDLPQGTTLSARDINLVTLLVSPEDSQKLQLASSQGTVQFVLRSGVDQKNVELRPTRLDQLSTGEKPAPPPAAGGSKRVVRKAEATKPVYILEIIQ